MPYQCPFCNEYIEYLEVNYERHCTARLELNTNIINYENEDIQDITDNDYYYYCPECGDELPINEVIKIEEYEEQNEEEETTTPNNPTINLVNITETITSIYKPIKEYPNQDVSINKLDQIKHDLDRFKNQTIIECTKCHREIIASKTKNQIKCAMCNKINKY